MGQTFSRRIVRGLERGMDKYRHQMEQEALQEVAAKQRLAAQKGTRFTDPNALQTGFTRGEGYVLPMELEQEAFLREQQTKQGGEKLELEPDLLKFLEEMGPVKKVVDVEFTSPRLVKHWQEQQDLADKEEEEHKRELEAGQHEVKDGTELQHPPATMSISGRSHSSKSDRIPEGERRSLQQMPLMENSSVTISRSTNFSTTIYAEDVSLGLTDLALYDLLRKQERELQSQLAQQLPKKPPATSGDSRPNPAALFATAAAATALRQSKNMASLQEELVSDFARQFYDKVGTAQEVIAEEDDKRQELLRKTLNALEHPAIMRDTDGYYFGVWPDRVDDLQVTSQLIPVSEYKIKLVLADITDAEQQNKKEEEQLQAPSQFSTRRRDRRQRDAY